MELSILNGMSLSNLFPPGSGIYVEEKAESFQEPEVIDDSPEITSSKHNRIDACMNSQRLIDAQTYAGSDQTKSQDRDEKVDTKSIP